MGADTVSHLGERVGSSVLIKAPMKLWRVTSLSNALKCLVQLGDFLHLLMFSVLSVRMTGMVSVNKVGCWGWKGARNGSLGVLRTRAGVLAFSSLCNCLRGVDGNVIKLINMRIQRVDACSTWRVISFLARYSGFEIAMYLVTVKSYQSPWVQLPAITLSISV